MHLQACTVAHRDTSEYIKRKELPLIFEIALSKSLFPEESLVFKFADFNSMDGSSGGRFLIMSQTDLTQVEVKRAFSPSREWIVLESFWTDFFDSIIRLLRL